MTALRIIEGVPYYRYTVRFRLQGKRRSQTLVHWSPGDPWIRSEIARGLADRFGESAIVPRSVTYRRS